MGKTIQEREEVYHAASKLKTDWLRNEILTALLDEESDSRLRQKILSYLGHTVGSPSEAQEETQEQRVRALVAKRGMGIRHRRNIG
jgi:truncated hemoglobin YjbI